MPVINADTRETWQHIADDLSKQRPAAGKKVRVTGGRKNKGREGVVLRHEQDKWKYASVMRYGGEANLHMRDMAGREGFRIQVREDSTGQMFWCGADQVEVL